MPNRRELFVNNMKYAKPMKSYKTPLDLNDQLKFLYWVQENGIPYDQSPEADYDMEGFWKAMQSGDQRATSAMNQNDGQMHFPDVWKTPYHESFSRESLYATEGAPQWNELDQLVLPNGQVIFDERARRK